MNAPKQISIKIASASCNQTAGDWPRNVANIVAAIDQAAADGADILTLEELGLTGYERGDDFYYSDNAQTLKLLKHIAAHAAAKAPGLVISIGHPWYLADKNLPAQPERRKNPLFNRINNTFDCQSLIAGGRVVAMSAKRYLFNYERGYEKRHFEEWSDAAAEGYKNEHGAGRDGCIFISVDPAWPAIPFGSPVVSMGNTDSFVTLHHIICEEYWVGSRYDGSADDSDYAQDNPLAQKAKKFDISIVLNSNGSPPAANKIDKHYHLSKLASQHCGVFVHTDGLGTSGSTFCQFGSRLMAQKGRIISEGARLSFKDMAYTSKTVTPPPATQKNAPHGHIAHAFRNTHAPDVQDGPALWEKSPQREVEEELRNECLWLFDYLRKNKIHGVAQALSGGADSAYNAAKVRLMIELAVAELGIDGFFKAMPHLTFKKDGATIDAIMDHMLTCVYMGTDNSSFETERAARSLIEGGETADGKKFSGIGGKFYFRNVQRLVELYAEIFSGVAPSTIDDAREAEIRREIADILRTRSEDTTAAELQKRIDQAKKLYPEITHEVLSVANGKHSLPYENIQARLRQVLIMLFANVENKIAISNPNLDEGRNSYATWGGDLHGGMISGNAHKAKQRQLGHMQVLMTQGLRGIQPLESFYWILKNRPSAELQPKSKDGKVTQFDEDQLGRSFTQMDVISYFMLYDRPLEQNERKNNPIEVFDKCRAHPAFAGDDIETLHDRIRLSYDKWAHAQFKIHGSPIAATYGRNIDKQSSLRTPNISAFFKPELTQLAIYCARLAAARDGKNIKTLNDDKVFDRALIDAALIQKVDSMLWTPEAKDGRKMKLASLINNINNLN